MYTTNLPHCAVAHQGDASLISHTQAREVRCAAFATTAALVVATQGADKLQFYKKPFELAGGLCKAAAMPALLQQHGLGNACTSL